MNILKKKMQRRTFLSNIIKAGLTIPLMNQLMVVNHAFAAAGGAKRFILVYYPNGCVRNKWHNYDVGTLGSTSLSNSPLEPLTPYVDDLVAFKNLTFKGHGGNNEHKAACRGVFSGGQQDRTTFNVTLGEQLQGKYLNSLHVGLWTSKSKGIEHMPFTKQNGNKITPNDNPKSVYDNVLADLVENSTTDSPETTLRKRVLLSLHENLDLLQSNELNIRQTSKLEAHDESLKYYQAVLDGNIDVGNGTGFPPPSIGMTGVNDDGERICKAQLNNIAMAFQADVTRVATFQFMSAQDESLSINFPSIRPFMGEYGSGDKLHYNQTRSHVSSHDESSLFDSQTRWYNMMIAYLLEQLKLRNDNKYGGKLFDNTLVLVMSEVGGGSHQLDNPGIYVVGGAGGAINGGTAIDCGGAGMSNLFLSVAQAFGLNWNSYGNSFGGINNFLTS